MTVDLPKSIRIFASQAGLEVVCMGGGLIEGNPSIKFPWADLGIEHVRFVDFGDSVRALEPEDHRS